MTVVIYTEQLSRGGPIRARAASHFQQTDKDLFILLCSLLQMDVLSDELQILQPVSKRKRELEQETSGGRKEKGKSKTWNPRPAPVFISGVPVI